MFIVVVYYIMFSITLIYGLYFVITSIIGLIKRSKYIDKLAAKENYFAILIPARNEEAVIQNLIESLNKQNYSKNKYAIYVIPNNCTDNTKEIAIKSGAKIIDCKIKTKTKGEVLKYAFNALKDESCIDAYIIFDADNIVHPDFLKYMNNCLSSGYEVAQGFRDAKNPSDNWISGSYSLYYLFQNVFLGRSRMGLGASTGINGTGFMIKKSLIMKKGFNTRTLTEDVEYSGLCALMGNKIAFVEKAITYDEYPCSFTSSWKQRKRWSAGIIDCMKLYFIELIKNFFKTFSIASLDFALIYLGPIMQIVSFLVMVMLIIFRIYGIYLNDIFSYLFSLGWLFFLITYTLSILMEIIVVYLKGKKPSKLISGILLFPIFIFTWIPINIVCLIKKQTNWDEIKHDRNLNINDVLKS